MQALYTENEVGFLNQYPASTQSVYGHTLVEFQRVTGTDAEDAADKDVLQYQEHVLGLAPATVSRKFATLSSFFRFLRNRDIRKDDPTKIIRRPKVDPYKSIKWLTKDETKALLRSTLSDARAHAMICLGLHGLRVGEIVGLNVEQYVDGGLRHVSGKGAKTRMIPLAVHAQRAVERQIGTRQSGPLFRSPRGRLSIRRAQQIIELASKQSGKQINPHALRHTFGTDAIRAGYSTLRVQRLLGHTTPIPTERYVHLDDTDSRTVIEGTFDYFENPLRVIEGSGDTVNRERQQQAKGI